jgi:hypothetical protein
MFCADLKEYMEKEIEAAKMWKRCCITITLKKMVRKEDRRRLHVQYAVMLKQMFSKYIFGKGVYIIPLEDAEQILANIDQLCEMPKEEKQQTRQTQPREKMELISFHLPKKMLDEIDRYAEANCMRRSEVIRKAIEEMLKKYKFSEIYS